MSELQESQTMTTSCGLGKWRPRFLQRFANRQVYLFFYSILGIIQGMGFTYLSSVLSTIEKQFGIRSQEAAWIFSGNEISQIFFIFLLPFLPRIKKRTLWTSIGMMASSIGFLLCAFPFFVKDKSVYKNGWEVGAAATSEMCLSDVKEKEDCTPNRIRDWPGMFTIFLGFFISGFGTSFYYAFGMPYLDDNVEREKSPMLLGISLAARTFGPALGYLLGNACLRIYVMPGSNLDLSEGDPGFLGAWWMGFTVVALLTLSIAPVLALFPERLPANFENDAQKIHKEMESSEKKSVNDYVLETKKVVQRLFRTKVYFFNMMSTIAVLFGFVGFATFIPKLFEYNYKQKASSSGSFSGLAKAFGSSIGMVISGIVISKFKFRARTLAGWNVFIMVVSIVALIAVFQLSCPNELEVFQGECSLDCKCSEFKFQPTCSEDGETLFFSPCHAGCRTSSEELSDKKKKIDIYHNCTCAYEAGIQKNTSRVNAWWKEEATEGRPPSVDSTPITGPPSQAVKGFCPSDCDRIFYTVVGIMMVYSMLGSTGRIGNTLLSFRAVEPRDKAASLLIMTSLLSLVAFLPSPIIVGKILDNTCTVWGENCGEQTACLMYDTRAMRTHVSIFVASALFVALIFDILVWYYAKDLDIFDDAKTLENEADKKEIQIESELNQNFK